MATDLQNIATIKSNTLAMLAELSASPKLTYSENGRSFSWNQYQDLLMKRVQQCNQLLADEDPFEVVTHGFM